VVNAWLPVPDLWLQMMAQKGYITFSVDNRGSCEAPRGHDFELPIYKNLGRVELADVLEGVKYLKSLPFVDPSRIGIFGGSFGGYMVLNAMLRAPKLFKAAVSFAPVTDWRGYDSLYTEQYMNAPQDNPAGYQATEIPPLAEKLQGDLLLLHGTADLNVHLHHSLRLVRALNNNHKHFAMMLYPGQGHASFFELAEVPQQMFRRITSYFLEKL
jgi:dipeptidyl-peptidase-4